MLSQTAEYALRAAVFLGQQHDHPQTTREIAEATRVPSGYLAKILQSLSRAGIVRSQRGLHGGFVLEHEPSTLTVYDVIQAVDPIRRILACPLGIDHGGPVPGASLCSLHQRLDDAAAAIERTFREATIADVLADTDAGSGHGRPLCEPNRPSATPDAQRPDETEGGED